MTGQWTSSSFREFYCTCLDLDLNLLGTANPDAGQGYMEGVIWRRSDLVAT